MLLERQKERGPLPSAREGGGEIRRARDKTQESDSRVGWSCGEIGVRREPSRGLVERSITLCGRDRRNLDGTLPPPPREGHDEGVVDSEAEGMERWEIPGERANSEAGVTLLAPLLGQTALLPEGSGRRRPFFRRRVEDSNNNNNRSKSRKRNGNNSNSNHSSSSQNNNSSDSNKSSNNSSLRRFLQQKHVPSSFVARSRCLLRQRGLFVPVNGLGSRWRTSLPLPSLLLPLSWSPSSLFLAYRNSSRACTSQCQGE